MAEVGRNLWVQLQVKQEHLEQVAPDHVQVAYRTFRAFWCPMPHCFTTIHDGLKVAWAEGG